MAKPFYSMEEVCELLGKDADAVKQLVSDGSLREFRDGGKVFFKAEDVDKLAGKDASGRSGTGEIVLEAAGEDEDLPSLADSGGGTSLIGLEAVDDEPPDEKDKEGTVITASGIGVFDDDELEIDADPMAKTQITTGATSDQVTLEGTGSGSGLLDLTREADDTSLGAELLDEIYPGEEDIVEADAEPEAEAEPEAAEADEEVEEAAETADAGEVLVPLRAAVAGDPAEGIFSGLLVGALILLGLAGSVAASVLQGYLPDYAAMLTDPYWILLVVGAGVVGISVLVGWLLGKALAPRRM